MQGLKHVDVGSLSTCSSHRIHTKVGMVCGSSCAQPCPLHLVEEELELSELQACLAYTAPGLTPPYCV